MPSYSNRLFKRFQVLLGFAALVLVAQRQARAELQTDAGAELGKESMRLMRRSYGDKLPDIPVVDHRGNRFRLFSDLIKDKAVIISFFYTDCKDACPLTNSKLTQMRKQLKNSFGRSIQILSISVDADSDTPEKVAHYARLQAAESSDPDMPDWKFLTGNAAEILKVRETIGLIIDDVTRAADIKPSAHGNVLVVGNQATGRWTLLSALGPMDQNMERVKRIAGWTQEVRYEDHRRSVLAAREAGSGSATSRAPVSAVIPDSKTMLPVLGKISGDLSGAERLGRVVQLSELQGKVTVLSHLYTVCPHGSKAVIEAMRGMNEEFGRHPDFHQVSMSAATERENPAFFRTYADALGVGEKAPWWFVSVERPQLNVFTTQQLGLKPSVLIPEQERLNAFDLYENDLRLVLLDRQGQVRGRYQVFHPDPEVGASAAETLRRDVRELLNETATATQSTLKTASIRP